MSQTIKRAKVEDILDVKTQGQASLNHCNICIKQDCASCGGKCSGSCNIGDNSDSLTTSDNIRMEFQEVTGKLQAISNELEYEFNVHQINKLTNETQLRVAKEMLKAQRQEIKNFFDKLESEIEINVTTVTESNVRKQKLVEQFHKDLQALLLEAQKAQKSGILDSDGMTKALEDIKHLEDTLAKLKQENKIDYFKYEPSKQIKEMMLTVKELGKLLTETVGVNDHPDGTIGKQTSSMVAASTSTYIAETQSQKRQSTIHKKLELTICARTKTDEKACTVTGICGLPDGFIVAIDCGNFSVKMIDTTENKTVSSVTVDSDPHDVTRVSDNTVAVTLFFKKQIQFFSVSQSKELSLLRILEVSSPCYGIIHSNDKLTVTHKNKLEVLNMTGDILRSYTTDSAGNQLFSHAKYVTQSSDQTTIYVSDYNNNTVTSLTRDGKVTAIYKDSELQMPFGLVVDKEGFLYVCGYNSNNIHRISGDLCRGEVILDASDGIVNPQCVAYSSSLNRLYVGMWCNDNIRAFQL